MTMRILYFFLIGMAVGAVIGAVLYVLSLLLTLAKHAKGMDR